MDDEIQQKTKSLIRENQILEKRLAESEKARKRNENHKDEFLLVFEKLNSQLRETIEKLKRTQDQLIESEKIAKEA